MGYRRPGIPQCCVEVQYENVDETGPTRPIHFCLLEAKHEGPHLICRPNPEGEAP